MTSGGLVTLPTGSSLYRIYRNRPGPNGRTAAGDVLWFGPGDHRSPRHRFDAPDGSYGVCYLAREPAGAFVETFLRDPDLGAPGTRILAYSELASYQVVRVDVHRNLRLAQLRGPGLAWRGVTASVSTTIRYRETQELSARIHEESPQPDGIEYRCRHDNDRVAVALFDRTRTALEVAFETAASCVDLAKRLEGIYPFVVDRTV